MVELLRPGLYFIEEPGQPAVEGVGVSECGLIGVTERGPDALSPIITSFSQYVQYYGSYYQGNYATYAAKAYFEQGGSRLRVFRVVQPGASGALQTGTVVANNAIDWATVYEGPCYLKLNNPGPSASLALRFNGSEMVVDLATDAGTAATVTTGSGGTDSIVWTATSVGSGGNSITVTLVDPGAASQALSISVVGTAITVSLETDGTSTLVSTCVEVVDAIMTPTNPAYKSAAAALVTASTPDAGVCTAVGSTPLVGGIDPAVTSTASDVVTLVSSDPTAAMLITAAHATGSTGVGVMTTLASTLLTGSAGAVPARANVTDLLGVPALTLEVLYKGAYGNGMYYTTARASTTSTAALDDNDSTISVADVTPFKLGDLIYISDGVRSITRFVTSISTTNKTLGFQPVTLATSISTAADVMTSSSNLVSTKSTTSLANGDSSITLSSARAVQVGQRLIIDDGTTSTSVVVTSINANIVRFDPVTLTTTIASSAVVASTEWILKVWEGTQIVDTVENLSMESTSPNYFMDRLSGDSNESDFVVATADTATSATYWRLPMPVTAATYFQFGDDGSAPTSTDVIGQDVVPRTGIYRLKEYPSVNFFVAPGFTAVAVQQAMIALTEENDGALAMECLINTPLADDKPDEALEFRNVELNADTNRAAIYYPWAKATDPENASQVLELPLDAYAAGVWARVSRERGVHKAPGNEILTNVQGLTYDITDGEHDILNPDGINAVVSREGRGIRIMGARTLQSVRDDLTYIGTRRTLDYIRRSLEQAMAFATFEPNDQDLWDRLQTGVSTFLFGLWQAGSLVGASPEEAYYVKSDEENNPRSEQTLGNVHVEVGVAITLPAEFVIFHLRRLDGENVVEGV